MPIKSYHYKGNLPFPADSDHLGFEAPQVKRKPTSVNMGNAEEFHRAKMDNLREEHQLRMQILQEELEAKKEERMHRRIEHEAALRNLNFLYDKYNRSE